jgi:hypothetical protein
VISGIHIIAEDERRAKFKSDRIIEPGMTDNGRFLGVTVAGAHSDVGGSYHRDGLAIRSNNLMVDYLNSLSDRPFLQKTAEPTDPRLNVVHRSEEGMFIYRLDRKVDRDTPQGYNTVLVPKSEIGRVADPHHAEPINDALNRQFERRAVPIGPVPQEQAAQALERQAPERQTAAQTAGAPERQAAAQNPGTAFDRLIDAAANGNIAAARQEGQAYAQSAQGQALLAQGQAANQQVRAQEQQSAMDAQLRAQQQAQNPPSQGPSLR